MRRYGIVIEKGAGNYSAYVPDLPGCVSTGRTIEELRRNIQEAIELHIDGLRRGGDPIPPPTTLCEYIEAAAA
jgi:predicted RNase H-like HicB family nuclease